MRGQGDSYRGAVLPETTNAGMSRGYERLKPQVVQASGRPALKGVTGFGVAVASTLIACLMRWFFDSYLDDSLPYATFLIAVAVTTWYTGVGASLAAVILGALLCNWFFVSPRYDISLTVPMDQAGMAVYLTVSFAMVGFLQTWRWAWKRSEEMAKELQRDLAQGTQPEESPCPIESIASKPIPKCES